MNNNKGEKHCKSSGFCHKCGELLTVTNISKDKENLKELELRTLKDISNLCRNHNCPPQLTLKASVPKNCSRCDYEFKTFTKFLGTYSKDQIRALEMEFIGKIMLEQKEHRKSCIKKHTQTRIVLIEKK